MTHFVLGLALPAGFAAFFNPCGLIVMLAFVSHYIRQRAPSSVLPAIAFGAQAGVLATLGFITLFTLLGVVLTFLGRGIASFIPQVSSILGLALILLGIGFFFGKVKVSIPTPALAGRKDSAATSFFIYGIFFALASLTCVAPIFLTVVGASIAGESFYDGVLAFVAYAVGMGIAMIGATIAIAIFKEQVIDRLKAILPYVDRFYAIVLVLLGVYIFLRNALGIILF